MQLSDAASGGPHGTISGTPAGTEPPCRFPKLEECAHFHYERVHLPALDVSLQTNMDQSLHSQHTSDEDTRDWYTLQVTCRDECWLIQRSLENFTMLDAQLHQCIYDRKVSQLPEITLDMEHNEDLEAFLSSYLHHFCTIVDNSLNCGPILNWFQLDNRGHRLLVPSEESRSINTPAVAAAYSIRKYVSQARDELSLEVGDMISVIDMASPGESVWWRGKRGFQVGFFPQHCVHIIGDKVPRNMPLPPPVVGFILNRPSRRRLKQSGILKERVFGCDLGEHLLNSGHEIPMVLKCCAEFIESHGIVDGIYRLSGVTSNIQKLRNAFDEDRIPNLYTDEILQDIHSVASLLKMYFRELPNPLCTYQLYQSFVSAVQGCTASRNKANDNERLIKMREAVQKLPPPHFRTLEYLMRHLARVAKHGTNTGMTTRNVAIVWAPNLLRCEELEVGGVAALQGVGVQAVVTEFLVCYADLIFSDHLPNLPDNSLTNEPLLQVLNTSSPKRNRPKSLAISTPTKLLTLEEARNKHLLSKTDDCNYIEVGGGPKSLPKKYHTVIELPPGSRKRNLSKRSPSGWRSFFSKSRNSSHGNLSKNREISTPGIIITDKSITDSDLCEMKRKLRPVKSAESLTSGQSEPATCEGDVLGPLYSLSKPPGHNRSVSHDSYFDNLQPSTNNSVGSLLDLSEIQINFELEESEMRIFSEDESLVSSPKMQKDTTQRKVLSRARPEEYSSANNSSNPSPKKQPRVVLSPDSLSRKRSRLEDQLSDIQYIDCTTPDNNPTIISTQAVIHNEETPTATPDPQKSFEGYQPKNKSPRSNANRHSLNFEKIDKLNLIPKSQTELNLGAKLKIPPSFSSFTPTPQTPNYKLLGDDNSSCITSPQLSPENEYENLGKDYENLDSPKSPGYENILTTISITYKSPVKTPNPDNIYEDIELNLEKAGVPTTVASLPVQEATQPNLDSQKLLLETTFDSAVVTKQQRPIHLNLSAQTSEEHTFDSLTSSTPLTPFDKTSKKSLITPSEEISMSEVIPSPSSILSTSSSEKYAKSSTLSPIVSPISIQLSNLDLSSPIKTKPTGSQDELSSQKVHEKRKSCDAEILDENDIYQQVKYFRRSVHEINSLLLRDSEEKCRETLTKSKSCNYNLNILDLKLREENSAPFSSSASSSDENTTSSLEEDSTTTNGKSLELETEAVTEEPPPAPPVVQNILDNLVENNRITNSTSDIIEKYENLDFVTTSGSNNHHQIVENNTKLISHNNEVTLRNNGMIHENRANTKRFSHNFALNNQNFQTESLQEIADILDEEEQPPIFDSLEPDNIHLYENIDLSRTAKHLDQIKGRMHENEPKTVDLPQNFIQELPVCSKCTDLPPPPLDKINVKHLTSRFETKEDHKSDLPEEKFDPAPAQQQPKPKHNYDKDNLPPCLRAKNAKNSVKTRSLDENAFVTEFGRSSTTALQRRKSLDDRTSSYINSKMLVEPPQKMSTSTIDVRLEPKTVKPEINAGTEQKLNRERIEKYKEERRNFLREKYRSESFKEDKDKLLSRLKSFKTSKTDVHEELTKLDDFKRTKKPEVVEKDEVTKPDLLINNITTATEYKLQQPDLNTKKTECKKLPFETLSKFEGANSKPAPLVFRKHNSPLMDRKQRPSLKELSDKILDDTTTNTTSVVPALEDAVILRGGPKEDEFRLRRNECDSERRRHTYDLYRERDFDSETHRRVSLENKNTRKEKCSPSYCIKDMKAIFESKSQQ